MPDRRQFLGLLGTYSSLLAGGAVAHGEPTAPTDTTASAAAFPPREPHALRIALMQASAHGADQQANLAKAASFCQEAAGHGADLLVMPEMWNIGYQGFSSYDNAAVVNWSSQAVETGGPWVGRFRELAHDLQLAIAVTYLQKWPGGPRNAVSLINRHGELVLTYAKVHTCDFAFEAALTPGDGWDAVDLDTAKGTVRVGAMICFDREFPESARSLMLAGAEVVVTPNACTLDDLRIAQFRVRAYENAMALVMANYATPPILNGRSVAIDAVGKTLVEADGAEGLRYADIDLAALRDYRSKTLWGAAWRRPPAYGALTKDHSIDVFRRKDAFGNWFDPSE